MELSESLLAARRKQMVADLRKKGISDEIVLSAMNAVPRHLFMGQTYQVFAYENKAFQIGCGQTISQPYTVALESQLLKYKLGEKILEIGTGSGYQSAVLAHMGAELYTIERQLELYKKTSALLQNYTNIKCFYGDGFDGLPKIAPFDHIIVTAGAAEVPQKLLLQIKIGGNMVIPLGKNAMKIYRITRVSLSDFKSECIEECAFVPMLRGTESKSI